MPLGAAIGAALAWLMVLRRERRAGRDAEGRAQHPRSGGLTSSARPRATRGVLDEDLRRRRAVDVQRPHVGAAGGVVTRHPVEDRLVVEPFDLVVDVAGLGEQPHVAGLQVHDRWRPVHRRARPRRDLP